MTNVATTMTTEMVQEKFMHCLYAQTWMPLQDMQTLPMQWMAVDANNGVTTVA